MRQRLLTIGQVICPRYGKDLLQHRSALGNDGYSGAVAQMTALP
jgi:hypothetical protein